MLGQHPECYGLPELPLFIADNLGTAWRRISQIMPHGKDGLLRTLAQLTEGEQTEDAVARAERWVDRHGSWSPRRVFDHIQDMVGPKILVHKSPAIAFREDYLKRMYAAFPEADYLHLTRHALGTSQSLASMVERSSEWKGLLADMQFDPTRVWVRCHQNIVAFAAQLPPGQCMRIKGEALLANPGLYLRQIAEWLGLRTDNRAIAAMMRPERSPYSRRGPDNAPFGNDPDFLEQPQLDLKRLARQREPAMADTKTSDGSWTPPPETLKFTRQFGYC